jgi:hypothetical protein
MSAAPYDGEHTHARLGLASVFDRNANGEHMLTTPFAVPSWEPRFAVDGKSCDAGLVEGLLEVSVLLHGLQADRAAYDIYEVGESRLALARTGQEGFFAFRGWAQPHGGLRMAAAAKAVCQWLKERAVYPPKPWFDGGEAAGFQIFDVPWRAHPEPHYGMILVEPKWFEIHQ